MKSTAQEYWDACLILAWRNFESYGQARDKFMAIVGQYPNQIENLLRVPDFCPNYVGVRHMMYMFLPKINEWLLEHDRQKDVELLKKLKKSKYNSKKQVMKQQKELRLERQRLKAAQKRANFESYKRRNRNHDTDWNVVK